MTRGTSHSGPLGLLAAAVALVATPAQAAGLSGGLEGMRALALLLLAAFAAVWIGVWLLVWLLRRGAEPRAPRHWLLDPGIPLGLRGLALVQYLLAFLYGLVSVVRCTMPGHYHNGRVAGEVVHGVLFGWVFMALAILSAGGTVRRDPRRGWDLGVLLGWLCVVNAPVFILLHGGYLGFDPFAPLFGALLLVLLHGPYRGWLGADGRPSPISRWARQLQSGIRRAVRGPG